MKAINIITLTEPHATFIVRIVQRGDQQPLVEFYDADYSFTPFGQFVTSYNFDTLKNREPHPLALNGGIEKWRIGGENAIRLQDWLIGLGDWQ